MSRFAHHLPRPQTNFVAKSFGRKVIKREQYRRAAAFGAGALGDPLSLGGRLLQQMFLCRGNQITGKLRIVCENGP